LGRNSESAKRPRPANGFLPLSLLHSPAAPPEVDANAGGPCHLCNASCCRYFALQIDKPSTEQDYDHIRWYLMHEGIAVWVDDGDWYLEVRTTCRHLLPDRRCGIYQTRPQICRDYGLPGKDPCEYFTKELSYDLYFEDDAQFMKWLEEKRARRRRNSRGRRS